MTTITSSHYHHPSPTSCAGIEGVGINPKHPFDDEDNDVHNPDRVLLKAKCIIEEWNTTVVPKMRPVVLQLLQQVNEIENYSYNTDDMKTVNDENQQNRKFNKFNDNNESNGKYDEIVNQTESIQRNINELHDRLHSCKLNIHHVLEVNTLHTKYLSPISKLPIFGKVCQKTEGQIELDHYYQQHFLHQYETANVEYREVDDICRRIISIVETKRNRNNTTMKK
jgi:hypothetical protein